MAADRDPYEVIQMRVVQVHEQRLNVEKAKWEIMRSKRAIASYEQTMNAALKHIKEYEEEIKKLTAEAEGSSDG